ALRRCPQAVFLRPRHQLYRAYSRTVWDTVRGVVPTVERTGLDEGYLDLGELARDFLEARVLAEAVQASVRAATSLTCSLGVASAHRASTRVRSSSPRRGSRSARKRPSRSTSPTGSGSTTSCGRWRSAWPNSCAPTAGARAR